MIVQLSSSNTLGVIIGKSNVDVSTIHHHIGKGHGVRPLIKLIQLAQYFAGHPNFIFWYPLQWRIGIGKREVSIIYPNGYGFPSSH